MAYIMMHAELTGVVCSGPRVGRQFTHALLDERVPPVRLVAREEALAPRVEKVINSRLSAFGEYAYFRDRFAGVANRNSGSAGLAMTLVSGGRQKLTADLGVGYLNEDRLAGARSHHRAHGEVDVDRVAQGVERGALLKLPSARVQTDGHGDLGGARGQLQAAVIAQSPNSPIARSPNSPIPDSPFSNPISRSIAR
jgi:hypothetical protein